MLRTAPLRVLDDCDLPAVTALLDRDPVANVFVASRVLAAGLESPRLGAQMWGHVRAGELVALCYAGANLVPVGADAEAAEVFAGRARRDGRRCSSIVGPADAVSVMWSQLRAAWGPARDVRPDQPLLVVTRPGRVAPDPAVRRVRPDELDVVLPACIAMFTEEVGVSPVAGDGGVVYRARVQELIAAGRAFTRIDDGRVLFKAEIGAATAAACQLQGIWVEPSLRGQGLGSSGTATVVAESLRTVAPVVSLYVNAFNHSARASYAKVGFEQVGTFMSVLF